MRRVLVAAWGPDADAYIGRRLTLYNDETIAFGPTKTGGIRIKGMSHIDKPRGVPLMVSRGKSATFRVEPLPDAPAPTIDPRVIALREEWKTADAARRDEIQAEDIEICEQVQKNLRSRSYDRGRYSPARENGVHHFHGLLHEFLT